MIYVLYVIMAVISLPLTLLGLLLAPVLPLFATNGWLPAWLAWFQTPDNSLYGDATFQSVNGTSYLSQVKWLLRNPMYGFGVRYLNPPYNATFTGDNTIKDNDNAKEGWLFVRAGGLFQFTYVKRIGSTARCLYVNFGWNVRALVDPNATITNPYQATFVFSPRISGFR